MDTKNIFLDLDDNHSYSFEKEERYFLEEMKRNIEKEKRREIAIKEEINIYTGGRQVILRNYK